MTTLLRNFQFWFALGAFGLVGCGGAGTPESTGNGGAAAANSKPRIVTTVGMVTDIVREVVGDRGEVIGLLSEGVDPHLYKPTREDVQQLSGAKVVFYGGLMLEGRLEESLKKLGDGKPVVGVAESLDRAILRKPPEFEGHYDPHVWMDVKLWSQCVEAVTKTMTEFDADHAAEFVSRSEAYRQKLAKLDEYVRKSIESIPEQQRVLVTAHDAFGYFAHAFGLEVVGAVIPSISTQSEPSAKDTAALLDTIRQQHAARRAVQRDDAARDAVAFAEFGGGFARGPGHAAHFLVKAEIGGARDGGLGGIFLGDRDARAGFDCLMHSIAPGAVGTGAAGEFIHDDDLALADDVMHIAPQVMPRVECPLDVSLPEPQKVLEYIVGELVERAARAFAGKREAVRMRVAREVLVGAQSSGDAVCEVKDLRRAVRLAGAGGDDERAAGFVDEHAVGFVDDGEGVAALDDVGAG